MTRSNDEIIAALMAGDAINAAEAVVYAQNQVRPFLERIAELEAALRELVTAFNPEPKFDYAPLGIWDRAAKVLANQK